MYWMLSTMLATLTVVLGGHAAHDSMVIYHKKQPLFYYTDSGWKEDLQINSSAVTPENVLEYCQKRYPNKNITNAVPQFHKVFVNRTCSGGCSKKWFQPIQCLSKDSVLPSLHVPSSCDFGKKSDLGHGEAAVCHNFHFWRESSRKFCVRKNRTMTDMTVLFPCADGPMLFSETQFVCCDFTEARQEYKVLVERYDTFVDKVPERILFSHVRHNLTRLYNNIQDNLLKITKLDLRSAANSTLPRHLSEDLIKKKFAEKYKLNRDDFQKFFTQADTTHFRRTMKNKIPECNKSQRKVSVCHQKMKLRTKKWVDHYIRNCKLGQVMAFIKYAEFAIEKYREFLENYPSEKNQLNKFRKRISSPHHFCPAAIDQEVNEPSFLQQLNEEFASLLEDVHIAVLHHKLVPGTSNVDVASAATINHTLVVVVIVVISTMILFGLAVLARHTVSHCPSRGTGTNYVMTTVANGGHHRSQRQSHASAVPIGSHTGSQSAALNLYENPVFNSSGDFGSRSIEKKSLIDNMEQ